MEKDRVKCVCLAFAASVVQWMENPGAKLDLNILFEKLEIETFSAPTQTHLAKWLREKHELYVHVECNASGWLWEIEKTNGTSVCWCNYSGPNLSGQWDTFEDALEDGLMRACEIVKQRNR